MRKPSPGCWRVKLSSAGNPRPDDLLAGRKGRIYPCGASRFPFSSLDCDACALSSSLCLRLSRFSQSEVITGEVLTDACYAKSPDTSFSYPPDVPGHIGLGSNVLGKPTWPQPGTKTGFDTRNDICHWAPAVWLRYAPGPGFLWI